MKKQMMKQILSIFLVIMCLGVSGVQVQASEEEVEFPIYPLVAMERGTEEGFVCQCFVIKDGDYQWMISTEMLEYFPTDAYMYAIYANDNVTDVIPAWTDEHVTVLYSPEKIGTSAFWLSEETIEEHEHALIGIDEMDADTMEATYDADSLYLEELRKIGKFYCVYEEEGMDDFWFGVPVIDAETIEAVGILGQRGDDSGFYEISGITLPKELAMENWGEEEIPTVDEEALAAAKAGKEAGAESVEEIPEEQPIEEKTEAPVETEVPAEAEPEEIPVEQPQAEEPQQPAAESVPEAQPVIVPTQPAREKDNNWEFYIPVAAGVLAAITIPLRKKTMKSQKLKKESEGKTVPADQQINSVENCSISLESEGYAGDPSSIAEDRNDWQETGGETIPLEEGIAATEKQTPIPVIPAQENIIKGLGGHLAGVRMPVGKGLTAGRDSKACELCFPQDAKGISGMHFSVSEEGEDIIIRDLNSSYGTFFENGERLMPDVAYRVSSGTIIYLAHGEDSFWVGKEEDEMNTHYQFAIKALAGELKDRTYYLARGGRMYFGRGEGCQVQFSSVSKGVSGNHCEIRWLDGKVVLVDNGSTNGTYFSNGMRLKPGVPYELERGMQFYLTDERNTFQVIECR